MTESALESGHLETLPGQSDLVQSVIDVFETRIPFNNYVGFRFLRNNDEQIKLAFDMRDELVGNFTRQNLHGGVISSSLDVIGGLVAFVDVVKKRKLAANAQGYAQFAKLGTIDLRVDYLRPGLGKSFSATGFVLRTGSKVAVTRMELHNDSSQLIATGTGAYIVG